MKTFLFKNQLLALFFLFPVNAFSQGIQDFTPDQIRSLLTPKQVKALTNKQIRSLRPAQISAFTPNHIEALEEGQIKAFKPSQIRGFQPSHFRKFSRYQLGAFEPDQVGAWNGLQLSGLGDRISLVTPKQLKGFRPSQIKVLEGSQIKSMSSRQLESLKPSQFQAFEPNQIRGFTEDHIESFSASDVLKFNSNQIGQGLTPQQLQLFDRAKFQALGPEYIRKLRTDHISALSDDHINFLKPNQIQAFTPQQAQVLNREQVRSMSIGQLRDLNSGQIKQKFLPKDIPNLDLNNNIYGLGEKQASYLTPSQKQNLIKEQYNGLSLRQFQSLTPDQIRSIDPEVLRGLSDNKLKSLTPKQIKALTPEQLNILKNNQLILFDDETMIDEETAQSMDDTEAQALALCVDCGDMTALVGDDLSDLCEMLMKSPLCKDVPEDKKKDCSMNDGGIIKTPYDVIWGCLKYSIGEILKAMWGLMKWVWGNITDTNTREETGDMAARAMESAKLYLHSEYEKAYEDSSFPGRSAKAVMATGASLTKLLYDSIVDTLSEDVAEWSCLNTQGKSGKICGWLLALSGGAAGAGPLVQALGKLPIIKHVPAKFKKWKSDRRERKIKKAEELMDHSDSYMRAEAARKLAKQGSTQNLMRMAADDSSIVRGAVSNGLRKNSKIGQKDTLDIVTELSKREVTNSITNDIIRIAQRRLPLHDARQVLKTTFDNDGTGNSLGVFLNNTHLYARNNRSFYRAVAMDIVDGKDFPTQSLGLQREMVRRFKELESADSVDGRIAETVVERIGSRTRDPIIGRYARDDLKFEMARGTNTLTNSRSFGQAFDSYINSDSKYPVGAKIGAMDHMADRKFLDPVDTLGENAALRVFNRTAKKFLRDDDVRVRHSLLRQATDPDNGNFDLVRRNLKAILPEDRTYFIREIDRTLRGEYRPGFEKLRKMKEALVKLE